MVLKRIENDDVKVSQRHNLSMLWEDEMSQDFVLVFVTWFDKHDDRNGKNKVIVCMGLKNI